jgi:hypothetical protein
VRKRSAVTEIEVPVKRPDLPSAPHPDFTADMTEPVTVTMPAGVYVWLREIVGAKYRTAHGSRHYATFPSRWRLVNEAYDVFAEPEEAPPAPRVKKLVKKTQPAAPVKKILKRR